MPDRLISDDDLGRLLGAADPIDRSGLASSEVDLLLAELRSATIPDRASARGTHRMPSSIRRVGRWRLATAGLVAGVVAVAVTLIGFGGSGGDAGGPALSLAVTPAQAAQLNQIAAVAAQQSGPHKGQWLYQRYEIFEGSGLGWGTEWVNYRDTREVQQWTSSNDVERSRSHYTGFHFDTPRDRATYLKYRSRFESNLTFDGPLHSGHVTDDADPSTGPSPLAPQNMPDTRRGLLTRFRQLFAADASHYPDRKQFDKQFAVSLFDELGTILERSTSPRQRSAAFRAMAFVAGVQVLGTRKDVLGRTGLAMRFVWHEGAGDQETIIIDRRHGTVLQDTFESLTTVSHITPAEGLNRTVFFNRAIVKSMSALPGGGSIPYHGPPPTIAKGSK